MKNCTAFLLLLIIVFTSSGNLMAQNNALNFDGTDDYVDFGTNPPPYSNTITIEAWIKTTSTDLREIVSWGSTNPTEIQTVQFRINSGKLDFGMDGGTGWAVATSTASVNNGQWTHVAVVKNNTATQLYINGVADGNSTIDKSMAVNRMVIGAYYFKNQVDTDYRFNGSIDEVRIWNDVRTEAEIRANMYEELDGTETGLVASYNFNTISGTSLTDNSSNAYIGTLTNMDDFDWVTSPAMFGPKNCLDFDGNDDYVECGNDASLTEFNNFTMEAWVKLENGNADTYKILGKFKNFAPNDNFYVLGVGSGVLYSTIYANGNGFDITGGVIPSNEWTHLAVTFSKGNGGANGTCYGYVNGEIIYSKTDVADAAISVSNATYPFRIGASPWGDLSYYVVDGQIDEVRIWNTARSTTEIRENMCKTLTGNESDLVAYYNFDNASGTILQDFSGNVNDGTLNNMANDDWVSSTAFNTWLNTNSTSWSTDANWSGGNVPALVDNVGIPNYIGGSQPTVAALACNNLVVGDNATLTFNSSGSHIIHGSAFVIGRSDITNNDFLTITRSLYILPLSTLNIDAGGELTIGNKLVNFGTCTIKSDATATGSLKVGNATSGDVIMERYIGAADWGDWKDGWHFLSSPVANYPILNNFTATDYDFFAWSEPNNLWINYKDGVNPTFTEVNGSLNFELGTGYMAAYKVTGTKSFTGSINIDDVTVTNLVISSGSGNNYSFHLLGNPFTCGLTWDATDDWGKTNIAGSAKIWNETGKGYTDIVSEGIIPATNGFLVQAENGTGSLTIPKSKRTHGGSFYKSSDFPIIKLKANNIDFPSFQESQLLFNPESTIDYEMEFDSRFLSGYAPLFYSKIDNMPMSVNSMPYVTETTSIPFTFIKNEGLNFSIQMYEVENIDMDIWLYDSKLNQNQNLTENPIYVFTSFEQDDSERFTIHFSALGVDETTSVKDIFQIWTSKSTINILNQNNITGEILIVNMLGQKVHKAKLNREVNQQIFINAPSGYYVINVVTNSGVVKKKIYLR